SGSNPIIITAYDATGNTGSVTLNVTRNILTTLIDTTDTAKPVITLGSPTTGTSYTANQASINLSGTATDNIGISKVTWSNSSSGKSGTATGTNTWSVGNVSLETGINPITLTAHDNAGNMGSITLTVTYEALDTEKPVVALVSPTTGTSYTVNQASVNLSGTAKDNIGVSKVVWSNSATGGSGTATGTANWSTGNIILAQGTNPILVNAYDTAENVGSYTINVTYNSGTSNDAVNPSISLSMPVTGTAYSTSSTPLTLSGKASDNVGVVKVTWVNSRGGSGNASGTSDWSIGTIDLKEGNNIISITAQDAMGNIASHTLAVTYTLPDTIKPVISLVSPTTGTTFDATVSRMNLAGTATDNIGVSRVTWTSTTGGFGTANGTTNWSIDGIELQLGLNTIIVTAFDAADNKSIHSLTVNYEPPKLTGVDEGSPDTGDPSDTPTIEKSKTDSVQPKEEQKTKARSRNRFLRLFGIGL
ncbi:MAG: hypothetical protein KJ737_15725, partial [Proteobacteria bacterium]|nr:hypothetical protein [Pseudomonadota bacterium]